MLIRRLELNDYNLGYLEMLETLTTVGNISYGEWSKRFLEIDIDRNIQIWVVYCRDNNKIVGSSTILLEAKFIHNLGKVAHIEDVVISSQFRGEGLGKLLINHLIDIANSKGCYKIILDCNDDNTQFYTKCGFTILGAQMALYLQ
jgi:ribosomal protein S18 acetylase RimI-like enzyme